MNHCHVSILSVIFVSVIRLQNVRFRIFLLHHNKTRALGNVSELASTICTVFIFGQIV